MFEEITPAAPVLEGRIVQPAADVQLNPLEALIAALAVLKGEWKTEAEQRRRGAQASMLFGPRQMILGAEGSVMLACAEDLDRVVIRVLQDAGTGR